MKDELLLIAVLFFGYVFLFSTLVPALQLNKEDPYQELYENNEKYSFSQVTSKSGGATVRKLQLLSVKGTASYKVRRKTLFGYVEVKNNKFPYFFDMILLPRSIGDFNLSFLHKWFFRTILLLLGITTLNEVIKWRKRNY